LSGLEQRQSTEYGEPFLIHETMQVDDVVALPVRSI
jgi:hypothetical protein